MGYITKDNSLTAYKVLSKNTSMPASQGATQFVSALRYLFALDRFVKKNDRPCDVKNKLDKETFIRYVGEIVSINKNIYTCNFYTDLKTDQDYKVGSNFFSVNVVKDSLVNPSLSLEFPRRSKNGGLFYVQNGILTIDVNLYHNISKYLTSNECKVAFVIWLCRMINFPSEATFDELYTRLSEVYSVDLLDCLFPQKTVFEKYFSRNGQLSTAPSFVEITKDEIMNLFIESKHLFNIQPVSSKENLTREQLVEILKSYYSSNKTVGVHAFGFEYCYQLDTIDSIQKLAEDALGSSNWSTEIGKTRNLRKYYDGLGYIVEFDQKVSAMNGLDTFRFIPYLTALRTKPFLLLAGISGTGKSRIVRELAFMTCPEYLQDKEGTTPGNYCMIEVKPNWHDSTELLGYWSNINNKYMYTKFIAFLVKAMKFPNIPFFVCLDEMNLAPVEQYFAEFLSILETRKHSGNDRQHVVSGILVEPKFFKEISGNKHPSDEEWYRYLNKSEIGTEQDGDEGENVITDSAPPYNARYTLAEYGLHLPDNVFIIGTVNMDDTTHQFSRKVIDRAMTIEMNGGALDEMFDNDNTLSYREKDEVVSLSKVKPRYISADEVLNHCKAIKDNENFKARVKGKDESGQKIKNSLPARLEKINTALQDTPFTVSYRVMNELVILLAVLLDETEELGTDITDEVFDNLMDTALDRILLMKILPRIEGDDEMFRISVNERKKYDLKEQIFMDGGNVDYTKLDWLHDIAPQHIERLEKAGDTMEGGFVQADQEPAGGYPYMAIDKLDEMIARLRRQNFTRFWP